MYESRIVAEPLSVAAIAEFPPEIDTLAGRNLSGHAFLRAAWYGGKRLQSGRTVVLRRGAGSDNGTVIAAIPTIPFGPAIARLRKVAGAYWPHRSVLIAPDCTAIELAQAFDDPAVRSLGPMWRIGPARTDDPTTQMMVEAAGLAGWTVLSRPAGTSWVIDLNAARSNGPLRSSVARKLRAGRRKLEALGTPHWRDIRSDQWTPGVLAEMGQIEADSWIARTTDGSGAKFLTPYQRAVWQHALADPVLAKSLSAVILMLDDRPVAFSFNLENGPVRYGIAASHVEDLKHCYIGKSVIYRVMDDCIAAGQQVFDLGAGDSGYKRAMGAVPGYDLADLLFVRSRTIAALLAKIWGSAITPGAKKLARG